MNLLIDRLVRIELEEKYQEDSHFSSFIDFIAPQGFAHSNPFLTSIIAPQGFEPWSSG